MKEKILYLMHVPWGHIKQRPHFIVEYLREKFDIEVFTLQHISASKSAFVLNPIPPSVPVHTITAYKVPALLNNLLAQVRLLRAIRKSRIIWLTSPRMLGFVKPLLNDRRIVIYDCMDDVLEFPDVKGNPKRRYKIFELERQLSHRADIIFCSSDYLREKLVERYGNLPARIVNNAVNLPDAPTIVSSLPKEIAGYFDGTTKKIVYIGTISEWFDFDVILKSLDRFPDIEYLLFGCQDVEIPAHDRIRCIGPIEHRLVFPVMERADALVMPFILNELVLSVNPVKVYEYIFSGKPAIIRRYPETEKFLDFVYSYGDDCEYLDIIEKLRSTNFNPRQSHERCLEYVSTNTWKNRAYTMISEIDCLVSRRGQGDSGETKGNSQQHFQP